MIEKILKKLVRLFDIIITISNKKRFKSFGHNSIIKYASIINHPDKIEIGSNVFIGDHVWLAANVTILKGVKIGARSVIAAGSVVASDIPEDCLAGGIPARVIRKIAEIDRRKNLDSNLDNSN